MKLSLPSRAVFISCLSVLATTSVPAFAIRGGSPSQLATIVKLIDQKALGMAQDYTARLRSVTRSEMPHFELSEYNLAVAFDVFFAYSRNFIGTEMLAGKARPLLIWMKSKPRSGGTTLLRLISLVLDPSQSQTEFFSSGAYPVEKRNVSSLAQVKIEEMGKSIILMDDFVSAMGELEATNFSLVDSLTSYMSATEKSQTIIVLDSGVDTETKLSPQNRVRVAIVADGTALAKLECQRILSDRWF